MEDIAGKVIEAKEKKIRISPCTSNRASECGHPCERFLVYRRTRWQEQALPQVGLQFIFDLGNATEEIAKRELADAGFTLIEQQRDFQQPEWQLTGHIDGMIKTTNPDGQEIKCPIEIKSMKTYDWDAINCIEDLVLAKKYWLRKYPAQLMMYMLMSNSEFGLLYLKNKQTGMPKSIWVHHDFTYSEEIVKKLERVNKHITNKTVPDPIPWDESICARCDFLNICTPDRIVSEMELLTDPELEVNLHRHQELKPLTKEFDELDRRIKKQTEGKKLLIGEYMIDGKWVEKKGNPNPTPVAPYKYWKMSIINMKGDKKDGKGK